MTEPDTSPSSQPFASEPAQFSGCGKPAVVGCLVLLIVLAAGLVLLMWKAKDLLDFAISEYRTAVMQALPAELSESERQRLDDAFDSALAAIAAGELDPTGLQKLQSALATPPAPGETLDRAEVLELTQALEAVSGGSGEGTTDQQEPDDADIELAPVTA